uniref:Cytochrome b n=1 Tax=Echinoderes svetlanae TaxID=1912903 RepID=A0A1I9VTV0_9BILA|nr:cytochrome b [Echinoderes svetlanae]APA17423.1 cytochrome b [Echinoderes svetlanae]
MLSWRPFRKEDQFVSLANAFLVELPCPMNITWAWNFGSLLGFCLGVQIVTGLMLAMHYHNGAIEAFDSVCHIHRDVFGGWLLRLLHANSASGFFVFIYLHIFRGVYYGGYSLVKVWMIGISILFLLMAASFVGYVLPFGQMSFWGATVITNLISAIPYIGIDVVYWIWGGFAVGDATILRFFVFHFLLPFVIALFVVVHLIYLHESGSSNPLGVFSDGMKVRFHPYYIYKDLLGIIVYFMLLMVLCMMYPYILGDCDNFLPANPMSTPVHIKPEWYFLWVYAILRCVPSKVGGVVLLVLAILILGFMCFYKSLYQSMTYYPYGVLLFWVHLSDLALLTWIGGRPAEDPYYLYSQVLTLVYFSFYIILPLHMSFCDYLMEEEDMNN